MLTTLTLATLLTIAPLGSALPICVDGARVGPDDELRTLYRSGRSYRDFLGQATRRKALWDGNTEKAEGIDPALVARARAVGGTWRLLAVAVDSCSDSVSTIPYLAQLVAMVDGLDMRIVDPARGGWIMEAHRTPDGRPGDPDGSAARRPVRRSRLLHRAATHAADLDPGEQHGAVRQRDRRAQDGVVRGRLGAGDGRVGGGDDGSGSSRGSGLPLGVEAVASFRLRAVEGFVRLLEDRLRVHRTRA